MLVILCVLMLYRHKLLLQCVHQILEHDINKRQLCVLMLYRHELLLQCVHQIFEHEYTRWLLKSGTERNGMEPFRQNTERTERNSQACRLASVALIMACSLSITRGYFALRMAGMSCTHCLKSSLCVFANLCSWIKNIAGMTQLGQEMC